MILLVGRPPEAPYFSQAEHLLYANQGAGNYQQVGQQPDEHILFSFRECDEQKETPGQLAGCFLYAKKATAGTLAVDHWQRCGWPNRFYFISRFWKSQKNIEKVLKKYKKSIDFCRRVWYYIITGRGKGTPTEAERRTKNDG
jgi:hypothetical protein